MAKLRIKKSKESASAAVADSVADSPYELKDERESEQDFTQLTNKELAVYIVQMGYSTRAESTLNRLSKEELLLIIANKNDEIKGELNKTNIESASELVKIFIDFMDEIHKSRDGKENNQTLKNFTQKQSISVSPLLNNLSVSNYGVIALVIGVLLISIDSVLGFANIKKLFIKKVEKSNEKQ